MTDLSIPHNLLSLQNQIKSICEAVHRNPKDVLLVAVSKKQPLSKVQAISSLHQHFAENYVQDLLERQKHLTQIKWHFIGRVQSNKLKALIGHVHLIHTISHLSYLEKAEKLAQDKSLVQDVLLQVNLSREISKQGFLIEHLKDVFVFLKNSRHIKCKGLMTLPPFTENATSSRKYFQELKTLLESLKRQFHFLGQDFKELSMGTSQDFQVAIEEGATMIRLGSCLFGPRNL